MLLAPDGRELAAGVHRGAGTPHAEVDALSQTDDADGATAVVTLEPCTMCAGAAVLARIPRIVLGAWDPKAGACGSVLDVVRHRQLNHWSEVHGGVLAHECSALLTEFFRAHRD